MTGKEEKEEQMERGKATRETERARGSWESISNGLKPTSTLRQFHLVGGEQMSMTGNVHADISISPSEIHAIFVAKLRS